MNYTTSDYLEQLTQDRDDLVDNLETKGITGLTGDETFTELVPEVLNISGGGGVPDWSQIGYSSTPQAIIDDFNYSKNIYDNWTPQQNLSAKFNNDKQLVYMPLVDTSIATNTQVMFQYCVNLVCVPLLDLSNVTNCNAMFFSCSKLSEIPALDLSSATNCSNLFYGCSNLTNVPSLDLSSATNCGGLFDGCSSLEESPAINIANCTNFQYAFRNCSKLKTIKGITNTDKVTSFYQIFNNDNNLENIQEFDFSGIVNNGIMSIYGVSSKFTDETLNNILKSCITAPANYVDKTLTHVGLTSSNYPASRIQALPSYQDFINAGWTIGY